jgi:hypothetical protein
MLLYVILRLCIVTESSAAAAVVRNQARPSQAAEVIMDDEDARRPAAGVLAGDAASAGTSALHAVLDVVRRLRACERAHLAGLLHDGPIQELAAMTLELGLPGTDASDGLARQVDGVGRELRRLQDELWPFPRPAADLIETLKQRTAWLLATPLAVAVGEGAVTLPEADVQAVADMTELILAGLGAAGAWDRSILMVRADPDLIFLELNMTLAAARDPASDVPAAARAWLCRVAAAIQVRVDVGLDGRRLRVRIEIPRCPGRQPGARARA